MFLYAWGAVGRENVMFVVHARHVHAHTIHVCSFVDVRLSIVIFHLLADRSRVDPREREGGTGEARCTTGAGDKHCIFVSLIGDRFAVRKKRDIVGVVGVLRRSCVNPVGWLGATRSSAWAPYFIVSVLFFAAVFRTWRFDFSIRGQ